MCQEKAGGKEKSLQTCRRVHETSGKANVQIGPLQLILECFERLNTRLGCGLLPGSQSRPPCSSGTPRRYKIVSHGLARRREVGEWERSLILHEFRREHSLVAAKAVSACLHGKVCQLGEGSRQRLLGLSMKKRRGGFNIPW